jgi:Carbohydrate binding module (family 6)
MLQAFDLPGHGVQRAELKHPRSVLHSAIPDHDGPQGELGFSGFTISDWNGIDQIHVQPGFTAAEVRTAINAGIDTISSTGGWQTWGSVTTNLSGSATGVHTLFITFTGSGGEFVNLNWFQFVP